MEFSAGKARPLLESWEFGFDFAILLRKKKPKIILVFSYFFRFRWFGRLSSLQGTFNIRAHIVDCVYRLVAVCMLRARGLFFLIFLQWEDLICYLMWQRNANLNHICIMKSPVVGDAIVPLYYCCCCCPRTTHTEQQQVKENGWNDTHKKMRKRSRVDAYSCVRELRKFSYLLVVDMPFFNFFFFFFFLAFFVHSFAYFRCCCCMWYSFIRRVCELRFWFFSITNEKKKKFADFFLRSLLYVFCSFLSPATDNFIRFLHTAISLKCKCMNIWLGFRSMHGSATHKEYKVYNGYDVSMFIFDC